MRPFDQLLLQKNVSSENDRKIVYITHANELKTKNGEHSAWLITLIELGEVIYCKIDFQFGTKTDCLQQMFTDIKAANKFIKDAIPKSQLKEKKILSLDKEYPSKTLEKIIEKWLGQKAEV